MEKALKRTESSDLLSVLDQLYTDTFSDSGVGLFGFDTDFFKHDALGVRGTSEWRGFVGGTEQSLLEGLISPSVVTSVVFQLASCVESSRLSFTHDCCVEDNVLAVAGLLICEVDSQDFGKAGESLDSGE
jgi:hypothetical protein